MSEGITYGLTGTGREGGIEIGIVAVRANAGDKLPPLPGVYLEARPAKDGHVIVWYVVTKEGANVQQVEVHSELLEPHFPAATLGGGGRVTPRVNETLTGLLDDALNALLLGERPVLGARMHCIVPMQYAPIGESVENCADRYSTFRDNLLAASQCPDSGIVLERDQAGRHYFLPHVHEVMIGGATTPKAEPAKLDEQILTVKTRSDDDCINPPQFCVTRNGPERLIQASVEPARLHLYTERTMALEYSLSWPTIESSKGLKPGKALWSDIALAGPEGWKRSAAAWLDFAEGARHIYSGFQADSVSERGKDFSSRIVGTVAEVPALSAWKYKPSELSNVRIPLEFHVKYFMQLLLKPIGCAVNDLSTKFEVRCDDRARVVQSIAIAGCYPTKGPAADNLPLLEARYAMIDEGGAKYFYEKEFADKETAQVAYDRFKTDPYGGGNRYFAHDHAFSHMGFGWFGHAVVQTDHMPTLYRRMALLLHLNGAVLHGMLRELGTVLEGWPAGQGGDDNRTDRLAALHRRYLKFLNLNWFDRVSSQIQGHELFEKMKETSPAVRELKLVDEQISRTSDYLSNRREIRKEARDRFFTTLLALFALLAGLPSLFDGKIFPAAAAGIDHWVGKGGSASWASELSALCAIWIIALFDMLGLLGTPIRRTKAEWKKRLPIIGALAMASIMPFAPLAPFALKSTAFGSFLWLLVTILGVAGGFFWAWQRTHQEARSDDRVAPLGLLYAGLLAIYVALVGLRATGLA